MQDRKLQKMIFFLILAIILILGTIYICIEKINSNKEISNLETKIIDMQNTIDELNNNL